MHTLNLVKLTFLISALVGLNACTKSGAASPPQSGENVAKIEQPAKVSNRPNIRFLEDRVKSDPEDFIALNKLASEYLQMVRETGDITYLSLASRAAVASLAILPPEQNKGGLAAMTQVEYSSHDFAASRDHAMRLTEIDPGKSYPFQMLGDALLELGQYEEAGAAFRRMEKLGGLQGITKAAMEQRMARLALLHGNNAGAERHLSTALKILSAMPEPPSEVVAWCQWQLGETAFASGDYAKAERRYQDSLQTFPDYFRSIASLGRVRAAQGDIAKGIELYEKVVRLVPDPNFVAALGDLYKIAGREQDAKTQYALVEQTGRLNTANGSLYNRQLALFYADHDLKPEEAYENATREYKDRRDIYGADTLAWTALKAGKLTEAQAAIKDALKLNTKDARLFYHAGLIAKASGDFAEAARFLRTALKLNPKFDPLQADNARSVLEALR